MTTEEFLKTVNPQEDTQTVYIMRGLPGSGKSTLAKKIYEKWFVYGRTPCCIASADNFWINSNGEYKFNAKLVPENHYWCLRKFIYNITATAGCIVLDNTNTSLKEFEHYVKIAQAYFYKVVIVTLSCDVPVSLARNTHNVPEETIKRMASRLYNKQEVENFVNFNKLESYLIYTNEIEKVA